jgi:nucleoside phosphorylase
MNDSRTEAGTDGKDPIGSLSPAQAQVLDLIAAYQLTHEAEISGKRLRVALGEVGLDDAGMAELIDWFVLPTHPFLPDDRYKLTLWGWVVSKHAPRVGALLGAVLTLFRDKFKKDPDFTRYSQAELHEYLPATDEPQGYFVREILDLAYLCHGEDGAGWRVPRDIEALRKLENPHALLQYRARKEEEGRVYRARAQRRLDLGFDPFDESADDIIDEVMGEPAEDDPGQAPSQAATATSQSVAKGGEQEIDFAILTALEVERRAVCKAFGLTHEHRIRKGARIYWRGRLPLEQGGAYELVVAQGPDAANVDAAILTNDLLHHWQPRAALMVGIAASADPGRAKLGDVVIGSDVYYYERGKETQKGRQLEAKILPADATLWSNVTAVPDWDATVSAQRPDGSATKPAVHYGIIASGEKVIADASSRDQIAVRHRKILAIEMEGYGFSRAVWQSFDRVRHLDIRGICDDGSSAKDDSWHAYAAASAASFARHFLLDRPLDPSGGDPPPRDATSNLQNLVAQWPGWAWLRDGLRSSGLEPTSAIELHATDARSASGIRSSWVFFARPSESLEKHFELASEVLVLCVPGNVIQVNDIERVEKVFVENSQLDPGFALVITADPDAESRLGRVLPGDRCYIFVQAEALRTSTDPQSFLHDLLRGALGRRRLFDFRLPAGDLQFFGREKELESLERDVLNGHSVGVFGLRKVGKTSLLRHLADKFRRSGTDGPKVLPIEVDLQATSYLRRNREGCAELIGRALDRALNQAQIPLSAPPSHPLERLRKAVEHVEQEMRARVLLILDEYEVLLGGRIPRGDGVDLLTWLRGLVQEHLGAFGLVLVGRNQTLLTPARIDGADNPMYRFLKSVPIAGLEPDDCRRMVQKLGGNMGLAFETDALDLFVQETGGHPALARTLGDLVDRYVPTSERNPRFIDAALVKQILPRFARAVDEDMRELVNAANDFDARAGDYLAHRAHGVSWIGGPPEARVDDALVGYGILHADTHTFRIGRLLMWLRENYASPAKIAHG